MRTLRFVEDEYYHILGRGNNKQGIFIDNTDYIRFLFLILFLQLPKTYSDISNEVFKFKKNNNFRVKYTSGDFNDRHVDLISFTLMPNHYHLVVKENKKAGISKYMQRVLNSFTKYHNTKYEKTGHLFQGPFKAVHVKDNRQLLHLSAYVHFNIKELKKWRNKKEQYPWSSYQDYINKNRWGELLNRNIILDQFKNEKDYRKFVEESGVKESVDLI